MRWKRWRPRSAFAAYRPDNAAATMQPGRVRRGHRRRGLAAFEVAFAAAEPGPDVEFVRALVPYMVGRAA